MPPEQLKSPVVPVPPATALSPTLRPWSALCLPFLLLCFAAGPIDAVDDSIAPEGAGSRSDTLRLAHSHKFMVATANPHATEAAANILRRGGNAVDAAVVAQLVLGLTEPQSSGLGGGGFALYWDARRKKVVAWDGREIAPQETDETSFLIEDRPMRYDEAAIGGRAVGVPGIPALLYALHRRHGKLRWRDLFDDPIRLAEQGFAVSQRMNLLLSFFQSRFRLHPDVQAYFLDAEGRPWPVGHILHNPAYAATLKLFRNKGSKPFYRGAIGKDIVAAVREDPLAPGSLSRKDLRAYRIKTVEPVCGLFRSFRICSMPPPSSGGIGVIATLGMLAAFDTRSLAPKDPMAIHLFAESLRLAFADRNAWVADPRAMELSAAELVEPGYLRRRARLINPHRALASVSAGNPRGSTRVKPAGNSREPPSTSHFAIIDQHGNIISMTSSIEGAFGSQIMVRGFLLNNQLNDFSFTPRDPVTGEPVANRPGPRKQPRSSMAPTLVFGANNRPVLALGSPGGSRIIPFVAQTLWLYLEGRASLEEAITTGRVAHVERGTLMLEQEYNWSPQLITQLQKYGHQVEQRRLGSGIQAISIAADGRLTGVADPRREGTVSGR